MDAIDNIKEYLNNMPFQYILYKHLTITLDKVVNHLFRNDNLCICLKVILFIQTQKT